MSEFKGTKEEWKKDGAKLIIGKITYVPQCKIEDFNSIEEFNRVTKIECLYNVNLMSKSHKLVTALNDILEGIEDGRTYITPKEIRQLIKEATELK